MTIRTTFTARRSSIDNVAEHAACTSLPTSVFFDWESERGPTKQRAIREVRAICISCPVVDLCLEVHVNEPWGMFGGKTPQERLAILRQRKAGGVR